MNFIGSHRNSSKNFGIVLSGSRTKYTYLTMPINFTLGDLGVMQPSVAHITWMEEENTPQQVPSVCFDFLSVYI